MIARRGVCLVLAAASGTGKTSLSRKMIAADSNLALSISMTTRAPRATAMRTVASPIPLEAPVTTRT